MFEREAVPENLLRRVATGVKRAAGEFVHRGWDLAVELGAIGPDTRRGQRFGQLGRNSVICFPPNALFNEQYIHIGEGTLFGPQITLSAGMVPGQEMVTDPVISVGDRCLIGKGSGIVGHLEIRIGDDVWTGHHVYITDQNHGYARPRSPDLEAGDARTTRVDRRRVVARPRHRGAAGCERSVGTSWSAPTAWSRATSPTTASPPVCPPG